MALIALCNRRLSGDARHDMLARTAGAPDAAADAGRSRRGRVSLSGELFYHWCQGVQVVDEE